VLAAFGLAGTIPVLLPGGQGGAWRAGQAVLKPADSVRAGRWFAEVYDALAGPGFRVPRPVRTLDGDWVADGWTAYRRVPGTAADWSGDSPRWPELVAVSRALHAALAGVPVPSWRATVQNPWTIGDEVAWGEREPGALLGPDAGPLAGQVRRLLGALRPVDLPGQLIHADLAGNVLFAGALPPAVIDFSPLERPAGLPLAVAAVDTLMWHRASPAVLRHLAGEPELGQLLARALIYRLITEIVWHAGTAGTAVAARTAQPVTDLVLARVGLRSRLLPGEDELALRHPGGQPLPCVTHVGLHDGQRPAGVQRARHRLDVAVAHGAQEVGLRLDGGGARRAGRQVQVRAGAAGGVGQRHHRAAVYRAAGRAQPGRPRQADADLLRVVAQHLDAQRRGERHEGAQRLGRVGLICGH
jgi:uncharacterized protein (TIGR02569 family)